MFKYIIGFIFILFFLNLNNVSYSQTTYDRLFVSETNIRIGEVIEKNSETLTFKDAELDKQVVFFLENIYMILNSERDTVYINNEMLTNKQTTTGELNKEDEEFISIVKKNFPEYSDYGFFVLEIGGIYNATSELIDELNEDSDSNFSIYAVEVIDGFQTIFRSNTAEDYLGLEDSDYRRVNHLLIPLNEGEYTLKYWSFYVSDEPRTSYNRLVSRLKRDYNPVKEVTFEIAKNKTTYKRVAARIIENRRFMRVTYDFEFETLDSKEPYYDANSFRMQRIIDRSSEIYQGGGSIWYLGMIKRLQEFRHNMNTNK